MEANPYAAPQSETLQQPGDDTAVAPRIFSFSGRLGRMRFFTYLMLAGFALSMVGNLSVVVLSLIHEYVGIGAYLIVAVASMVFSFSVYIRRLHDINASGWWCLLVLLPVVLGLAFAVLGPSMQGNPSSVMLMLLAASGLVLLVFFLILLFKGGNDESNHFGPPTTPNSTGVIVGFVLTLVLFGISALGIIAAVSIPAYQDYVERSAQSQSQ